MQLKFQIFFLICTILLYTNLDDFVNTREGEAAYHVEVDLPGVGRQGLPKARTLCKFLHENDCFAPR